jgi:hypothetical protein
MAFKFQQKVDLATSAVQPHEDFPLEAAASPETPSLKERRALAAIDEPLAREPAPVRIEVAPNRHRREVQAVQVVTEVEDLRKPSTGVLSFAPTPRRITVWV